MMYFKSVNIAHPNLTVVYLNVSQDQLVIQLALKVQLAAQLTIRQVVIKEIVC